MVINFFNESGLKISQNNFPTFTFSWFVFKISGTILRNELKMKRVRRTKKKRGKPSIFDKKKKRDDSNQI
jgi:hypothetical protein